MFDSYKLVVIKDNIHTSIYFKTPAELFKTLGDMGIIANNIVNCDLHKHYDKEVDRQNKLWDSSIYFIGKYSSTYKYCDMYLYGFRKKRKKIRGKLIASDFRDEIYNKSWVELMLNKKEKSIWDKLMKRLSY